jgi:uncharacterized lipoprotein
VNKLRSAITILLAFSLLSACASTDSRYKDNGNLERPPAVATDKQSPEQLEASERAAPKRRHGKGLKSDVYKVEGSPLELKIKRPYDEAWILLHHAIQHNELKVTDQDRSRGFYYVAYNGSGFFSNATSLFDNDKNQTIYLLKVVGSGDETSVVVSLASKDEQTNSASTKNNNTTEDASAKLVDLLYDTLHDDVKDE